MSLAPTYRSILALSERMVELAKAEDWDELARLETERNLLFATLPSRISASSPGEQKDIAGAIKGILDCNNTIREYVSPWLEHVGNLLAALAPKG